MNWTAEQDAEFRTAMDGEIPSESNGHRERVDSSWLPVLLGPIVAGIQAGEIVGPIPTLMARTDGVMLLYPGEVHSIAGEPETGKGFVVLNESSELIANGHDVFYIDFEDSPASIVTRLLALGASPDAIIKHFAYVRPLRPVQHHHVRRADRNPHRRARRHRRCQRGLCATRTRPLQQPRRRSIPGHAAAADR